MGAHNEKEHCMRKTFIVLSAISAIALATPALAKERGNPGAVVTGAAAGTLVGLGLYNGWFGSGTLVTALPISTAGAAAAGGVAGVGTIALIDAATQPCRGFRALFSPFAPGASGCANGEYVGYGRRARG
jgi:hypothetical protein